MISLEKYIIRSQDVLWRMVDDEAFIISAEGNKIHQLNKVGSLIWKLSEGDSTIRQIVSNICDRFEVSAAEAENDASEFIERMLTQGLVELRETPATVMVHE